MRTARGGRYVRDQSLGVATTNGNKEMMQERGVEVDHYSLNRWVIKYTPALDKTFRQRKRSVGTN